MSAEQKFIRREREHLDVLERRLAWLRSSPEPEGGYTEEAGFFAGEAGALAWALGVLRGEVEPLALRVDRLEQSVRVAHSRLGRVEHEIREAEAEDADDQPS